jgi:ATP-dependent Clp protease adapter protein ClpS
MSFFRQLLDRVLSGFRPPPGRTLPPGTSLLDHPDLIPPGFVHGLEILNDDSTPMAFVVSMLRSHARLSETEALKLMLMTHRHGGALVPMPSMAAAEAAAAAMAVEARSSGHPFRCRAVQRAAVVSQS